MSALVAEKNMMNSEYWLQTDRWTEVNKYTLPLLRSGGYNDGIVFKWVEKHCERRKCLLSAFFLPFQKYSFISEFKSKDVLLRIRIKLTKERKRW